MPTLLDQLLPFRSAAADLARRDALPTNMTSDQIGAMDAVNRRNSFVSARNTMTSVLDQFKADVDSIVNPVTKRRADRVTPENPQGFVTEGLDPATARLRAKELLRDLGYAPDPKERGTIKDLSSDKRINLVIKTNVQTSQGAGFAIQSNDPAVLEAFPCWELYRLEDRKMERDWPIRWRNAAQVAGDVNAMRVFEETGRMIARKDSEIWQALGDGAGGYRDTLGNPYPPFAFSSGMWTRNVGFQESEQLGLVTLGTHMQPSLPDDLSKLLEAA